VLDLGRVVANLDVGEGVRATFVADQQRVALRVVPRILGFGENLDHPAIAVVRTPGGDAFRDDAAARVLADVDHLRAGVGLLSVISQRD